MLLPKPESCKGCPFYGNGHGFVPDEVVPDAPVEIMGQNPGANEEAGARILDWSGRTEACRPAPYLGKTGLEMVSKYFPIAGLERGKVTLSNAIRCRVRGGNSLPPVTSPLTRAAIEHCQRAHGRQRSGTTLIVAEGEYALWATTGEDGTDSPGYKISRGIAGWRGWVLPYNPPPLPQQTFNHVYTPRSTDVRVLPTYHTAFLFRSPWERPAAQADWKKIPRILRGTWPEPFPEISRVPPHIWPQDSAFDTEFWTEKGAQGEERQHLTRWSLATRGVVGEISNGQRSGSLSGGDTPLIWVVEKGEVDYVASVGTPRVYFHNIEADQATLRLLLGDREVRAEDTMFMHAVLWPDMGHTLDYCGSVYARTNRWKHLVHSAPVTYAGGDALGTLDVAHALEKELGRDPRTRVIYEALTLPLVPIIQKNKERGIRVHPGRVEMALRELDTLQRALNDEAQGTVGYPINLGSDDQVRRHLYEVEKAHVNPMTGRPWRTHA